MTDCQRGILEPTPPCARYLTLSLNSGVDARDAIVELCRDIDGAELIVGLGHSLLLATQCKVPGSKGFTGLAGCGVDIPATQASAWVWLRGDAPGALVNRSRQLLNRLKPQFSVHSLLDAFTHQLSPTGPARDLSGYEDGTENPEGEDALKTAFVSGRGAGLDGSSFVAVQRWRHRLNDFDALSATARDHCIGRRLSDNEELEDAPESAHVKRTAQESFSPEAFMLRRSMPWADASGEGLHFVCFANSYAPFEAQIARMAGLEDGIVDALFNFSQPLSGGFYWCPPMAGDELALSFLEL